jgi:lipopolysaccharide export system permease protein
MSLSEEKKRGSSNINIYMVVLYKSTIVSAFILTIIAVSVSYKKRGGMGMNLTIGIAALVFFDKIFGTLAENLLFHPCGSQYYFRILAIFYFNAKR